MTQKLKLSNEGFCQYSELSEDRTPLSISEYGLLELIATDSIFKDDLSVELSVIVAFTGETEATILDIYGRLLAKNLVEPIVNI